MIVKIIIFDDVEKWGHLKDFGTTYLAGVDDDFIRTVKKMSCPFDIADYLDCSRDANKLTVLTSADKSEVDVVIDMRDKIDIDKAIQKMLKRGAR